MVYRHPLIIHSAPFGRSRYKVWDFSLSTFAKPHQTTDDDPHPKSPRRSARGTNRLKACAMSLGFTGKKTMNRKNRLHRVPWAHKTMKNKGFGHLKTWLFTIKTSKHVGLGGPWYIINIIRPKNGASFWMMMNPYSNHGETRIPTYEKWWLVGLPGKGLKSYPS